MNVGDRVSFLNENGNLATGVIYEVAWDAYFCEDMIYVDWDGDDIRSNAPFSQKELT